MDAPRAGANLAPASPLAGGPTMHQPSPYQPQAAAPAPRPAPSATSLVGRVKLVVEQGKILGEQFLLTERELIIGRYDAGSGRCPDIDLTAQDPAYVHRQHVRLVFAPQGSEITVFDMGGRNGSYVNNQLIARNGAATLHLGDKLRIGRVVLRLQAAPEIEKELGRA
jgi:pSer/pThr/pTyr-binding forkhead associated (FHA) protein